MVIHILAKLSPSGMERMLVSAAPYVDNVADVIIVGQGGDHPFSEDLREAGYEVVIIPSLKCPLGVIQLAGIIRRSGTEVVHIHTEATYWQAVLAVLLAGTNCAIVRTIHSMFDKKGIKRLYRRLQNALTDWRVQELVACSSEVQAFEMKSNRATTLIWNWVDDRFFDVRVPTDASRLSTEHFLIVGNCSGIKNHDVILQAALALVADGKRVEIAHYGSETNASERELILLAELEAKGAIAHRGSGDPLEFMASGPTFLLSSTHEGMCVALAEAIVAGIPAIVADAPGVRWSYKFQNVIRTENRVDVWKQALLGHDSMRPDSRMGSETSIFRAREGVYLYQAAYRRAKATRGIIDEL